MEASLIFSRLPRCARHHGNPDFTFLTNFVLWNTQGDTKYMYCTVLGGNLLKRFHNMFSENSSCLLWQRGSCSTAQRPVELSENILQNLFNKLQTQTAERRCNTNLSIHNGFVWISRPIFLGDEGGIHGISPPRNRYSAVQRHCSVLVQYQAQRPLRHGNASRRLPRAPWFQVGGQQVGARGRQHLYEEVHRRYQHLNV